MNDNSGSQYWERRYRDGHRQRYPWDNVVSFLFRSAARLAVPRAEIAVLEVGFGTGANLWCAAREGFRVAGVEASPAAVGAAREWFDAENLAGDLREGVFTDLPFAAASFDLIIDRAALTCASMPQIESAASEIARVARPGALFFLNCYSDEHCSARSGIDAGRGTRENITSGSLAGLDRITFLSPADIHTLLGTDWDIESLRRSTACETQAADVDVHGELTVVARRR